MTMRKSAEAKITKIGNSHWVLIPSWMMEAYELHLGDTVEVTIGKKDDD